MNWGIKITVLYLSFVGMILSLVFMSMREKVDLVSKDYYAEEVKYQTRLDAIKNTSKYDKDILATCKGNTISIQFPNELTEKKIQGNVHLYRPSNSSLDIKKDFSLSNAPVFSFNSNELKRGLYKIKISWTDGDNEFYHEQSLFVNEQ